MQGSTHKGKWSKYLGASCTFRTLVHIKLATWVLAVLIWQSQESLHSLRVHFKIDLMDILLSVCSQMKHTKHMR